MALNYFVMQLYKFARQKMIFSFLPALYIWMLFLNVMDMQFSLAADSIPISDFGKVVEINSSIYTYIKTFMKYGSLTTFYILFAWVYEKFLKGILTKDVEISWYDVWLKRIPFKVSKDELIIGVRHVWDKTTFTLKPKWMIIPEEGLFLNVLVTGSIGTGKTVSALYQFTVQFIAKHFNDAKKKYAMLILDVKGTYADFAEMIATEFGRAADVIKIELGGNVNYNPLHKPNLKESELAQRVRQVLGMLTDSEHADGYWLDQAQEFVSNIFVLIRLYNDGYINMEELNKMGTQENYRNDKIKQIAGMVADDLLNESEIYKYKESVAWIMDVFDKLDHKGKQYIVSELTRMTRPFLADKDIRDTFSPSRDDISFFGFEEVIEKGLIVLWKIRSKEYPKLSKLVAAYLKLDYQTEILNTVDDKTSTAFNRIKVTICDEYQDYVTEGDPDAFDKMREPRGVTVVATQNYNSLKRYLKFNDTLVNHVTSMLINKIWFRSDCTEYTIPKIIKQIGEDLKERTSTTLSETSQKSFAAMALGFVLGNNKNLTSGMTISQQKEEIFDSKFLNRGLAMGEAVCILSDGEMSSDPMVLHLPKMHIDGRIALRNGKIVVTKKLKEIFGSKQVSVDELENDIDKGTDELDESEFGHFEDDRQKSLTPDMPSKASEHLKKELTFTVTVQENDIKFRDSMDREIRDEIPNGSPLPFFDDEIDFSGADPKEVDVKQKSKTGSEEKNDSENQDEDPKTNSSSPKKRDCGDVFDLPDF
jgi:hypothetical protein